MNRLLIHAAIFFLALTTAFGQSGDPQPTATLHVTTQLTMLDVSVESLKTGERISGLTPVDFLIEEDGVPQKISYLSEDRLPLSLVLMFDVTDTEQPILHALGAGAREAVAQLRSEDEVSIMLFSSRARLIQDFTTNHALLLKAIDQASHTHDFNIPTFISEVLYGAAQQATHSTIPNSRRAIVFLTDGTSRSDANSQLYFKSHQRKHPELSPPHTMDEAMEEVLLSRATVDGLVDHSWMTWFTAGAHVNHGLGRVSDAATPTGGVFLLTTRKEVVQHLARLIDTLRHRYTVGYKPTTPQPPGTLCRVKVMLSPAFFARHITLTPEIVTIRSRDRYLR